MKNKTFLRILSFAMATGGLILPVLFPASIYGQPLCLHPPAGRQVRKANIAFEENLGQFDPQVIFAGKGDGQTVYLTGDEATFVIPMPEKRHLMEDRRAEPTREKSVSREEYALKMKFMGASYRPQAFFEEELDGVLSYFKGNDPSKWVTGIARYGRVTEKELYRGIDITWYENNDGRMEFDLIVGPKGDPDQIDLEFKGADRISVDEKGNLLIETAAGTMRQDKPIVYQVVNGLKQPVEGRYNVSNYRVGFALGSYDRSKTLVIDPPVPLVYSTYMGGDGIDRISSIKLDSVNSVYVAGYTGSTDFPQTYGTNPAGTDAFVTKLNPNGNGVAYSAFLSGSATDSAEGLAVDGNGNAYVTGWTGSNDFPVSWIAYDKTYNGLNDAFVTKINSTGTSLLYSTYLGGSGDEFGFPIALDSGNNAYVAGKTSSTNYPTSVTAFDHSLGGAVDAFITKLSPTGNSMVYSSYLGGNSSDAAYGVAIDASGNAYLTGSSGAGFPVTAGAYSTVQDANGSCFVTKFNFNASGLIYSSVIGGSLRDGTSAIALDSSNNAYITGYTLSSNYPTTFGAYDISLGRAASSAVVTKLNSSGSSLIYSTYLGGTAGNAGGYGIKVDSLQDIYVTGETDSSTFPVKADAFDTTYNGGRDTFLTKMHGSPFAQLAQSTFLGGSGVDVSGDIALTAIEDAYVAGYTTSANFPITPGVLKTAYGPLQDGFISCFDNEWLN